MTSPRIERGYEVPRIPVPQEKFTGDVHKLRESLDRIDRQLDPFLSIPERWWSADPSKREAVLDLTIEFNLLGVSAANIASLGAQHGKVANGFHLILFRLADTAAAFVGTSEALGLLARYAVVSREGKLVGYDLEAVEFMQYLPTNSCSFYSEAQKKFRELLNGLRDSAHACHAVPACSNFRETAYSFIVERDRENITLSAESGGFLTAEVDVYCGIVKRETIHLKAGEQGRFTSGPIGLCGDNIETTFRWKAEAPYSCRVGTGLKTVSPRPPLETRKPAPVIALEEEKKSPQRTVILFDTFGDSEDKDIARLQKFLQRLGPGGQIFIARWDLASKSLEPPREYDVSNPNSFFKRADKAWPDVDSLWEAMELLGSNEGVEGPFRLVVFTDALSFRTDHDAEVGPVKAVHETRDRGINVDIRGPGGFIYTLAQKVADRKIDQRDFDVFFTGYPSYEGRMDDWDARAARLNVSLSNMDLASRLELYTTALAASVGDRSAVSMRPFVKVIGGTLPRGEKEDRWTIAAIIQALKQIPPSEGSSAAVALAELIPLLSSAMGMNEQDRILITSIVNPHLHGGNEEAAHLAATTLGWVVPTLNSESARAEKALSLAGSLDQGASVARAIVPAIARIAKTLSEEHQAAFARKIASRMKKTDYAARSASVTEETSAAALVNFVPFGLGTRFVERPGEEPLQLNRWERHYVSRRVRSAGENDLNALAAKPAATEEGFEYIEGRVAGLPVALWYETGFDESEHRVFLERDPEFIRGAQQVFDEVTAMSGYHYHPRESAAHHESEYPSDGDFEGLIWDGLFHKEAGLPKCYDRRVVTSTGVMIMTPNYSEIDQDQAGARRELERYKQILQVYLDDKDPSLAPLTQQEKCRRFAKEASSKFFQIRYQPFERKEKETNDGRR